jgi:N-acetylglucosaminyldiphosphoundecaprenol N-acetyl-beta-D-mannosaminyltransferase
MSAPNPSPLTRVDVLGLPVSAGRADEALDVVTGWIERRERSYATFMTVHAVMESQRRTDVLAAHRGAGLVACDGMPLVWATRRAGVAAAERVYGPDFMLALCARAELEGWTSFFYGGKPGVADTLAAGMRKRFPDMKIAGTYSPPFRAPTAEEEAEVDALINTSQPDIVWVGISTPKQELWMARHRATLDASVLLGVGAAFDFHAGAVRQAPVWMQRLGLEWCFRLAMEPRRLAGRYLRNNPSFVVKILRHPPRVMASPEALD